MKLHEKYLNEGFYEDDDINKRFATKDKRAAMIRKEFKSDLESLINKMNKKYPGFFVDSVNNTVYALSGDIAQISMRTKK
jgi:hypothetical protein